MKPSNAISLLLLLAFSGCAARPAYFGDEARVVGENGARYWEAAARTPSYLQVRMRRLRPEAGRSSAPEATEYAGTLSLGSSAPAVLRSTFTLAEGASASFHYDFNAPASRDSGRSGRAFRYFPGGLDVVVACAQGKCWADSEPLKISPEGWIALKSKKLARGAGAGLSESLKKDNECAILHDSLLSLRGLDASIRAFTARFGEAETRAMAKRVQGNYAAQDCAAWLDEHGGVGAAWRRVRVAQWTSFRGD
jgi:hypothetical protein